jgi:hypothetical protein
MDKNHKVHGSIINKRKVLLGVAVLLVGPLIYLVDRPPDQTWFIYSSRIKIILYKTFPSLFHHIGKSLPSFIHVFSFILITAGLISCNMRRYLITCSCWFLADCAFELGQKHNSWSSKIIPSWFAGIPFLENTKIYFLQRTLDTFDMAAITIGAVVSYFVILVTMESGLEKFRLHYSVMLCSLGIDGTDASGKRNRVTRETDGESSRIPNPPNQIAQLNQKDKGRRNVDIWVLARLTHRQA